MLLMRGEIVRILAIERPLVSVSLQKSS